MDFSHQIEASFTLVALIGHEPQEHVPKLIGCIALHKSWQLLQKKKLKIIPSTGLLVLANQIHASKMQDFDYVHFSLVPHLKCLVWISNLNLAQNWAICPKIDW